ncbi:meiosis protein SPO22/ZIP4 like-domain-containing protein [Lentinula detonsa]|uniref:Meiosis protein SPO22/ZIP4 like-domain-containing protein n=1 Tax=Lentinula detonsa TaxID=2804962 RepID=A0AA38USV6_9AGAR|nr:meiosis protein SPO22/ZIP4 like-domain-containing protein [Lentinula detonsa]
MSGTTRKKKPSLNLQESFESIKDLLSTTKTQLDSSDISLRPSIIENLGRISALAESFTDGRLKADRDCTDLCDTLDQEGVTLWNISGLVSKYPDDDGRAMTGALRLAAFRLVEAGLEGKPGLETLIHVLGLASKTGATLSALGQYDVAASVLTSAAKYEEMMRVEDDPDGTYRHSKTCVRTVYFSCRMESAWQEGNCTVAEFMAQKLMSKLFCTRESKNVTSPGPVAIYDEQRLVLPAHDRVVLAAKLHRIGKTILQDQAVKAQGKASDAIVWLRKAFGIVDQEEANPGALELKISILRTLARAYFLSECYDSAEATLEELTPALDASKDHKSSEYQELRWLKLATLKKRQPGDTAILAAFKSIINHMDFTEANVTEILRELRTFGHQQTLVSAVTQYLLQEALQPNDTESESVDRILLSLIVHCSKDEVHSRAMESIHQAFTSVCEADTELRSIPAAACLSLLWQYGDRHYHAKRWLLAADWFAAGSHRLFRAQHSTSASKCHRKAALCYIEQHEYSRAAAVIRCCPSNEAATHYLAFLVATFQGLEDEAIQSMYGMVNSPDFDRQMLLLATKISHESEMKNVLLAVLEALLKTLNISNSGETVVEAMALLRCIIRLVLKLLAEPTTTRAILIDSMVAHFRTAKILADTASKQKVVSLIIKDVTWLWRTAYNCAVQGCSDWDGFQEQISALFDISKDMIEQFCQASPVEVGPDLYNHLMNASFSSVAGRGSANRILFSALTYLLEVFAAREALKAHGAVNVRIMPPPALDIEPMREISAEIKSCKARISHIIESEKITGDDDLLRARYFLHTLRVFEAEILAQLKDWDQLSKIIGDAVTSGSLAVATYEAIADILWEEKECPVNVLCGGLEAVLHATLDHNSLSLEKYARWLRAIATIILARNTSADRIKAIGYIEQAVSMMENSVADESYPMDERFWLLATSYNTGFECLEASLLDEAKRWFEASTVICKFVPGGTERAEKISETYAQLLSRYAPT